MRPIAPAFLALLLSSSPVLAGAATQAEADRLAAVFQSWAGKAQSFAKAAPEGDSYRVTLDLLALAKSLAEASETPPPTIAGAPVQFTIRPLGDGKWAVSQKEPFDWSMAAGDAFTFGLKADAVDFEGVFDETLQAFTEQKADIKGLAFSEHLATPEDGVTDIAYRLDAAHFEGTGTDGGNGGVDGETAYTFSGLTEVINAVPAAEGETPMSLTIRGKDGRQTLSMKGFKTRALFDLIGWTFNTIPQGGESLTEAQLGEMKEGIAAVLPVFQTMSGTGAFNGITVDTPLGVFGIEQLGFGVEMNGAVHDGLLRESFTVGKLTLPEGVAPPWAGPFVPDKLNIDVKVSGFDLAEPASLMLANFSDFVVPIGSGDLEDRMMKALVPTGAVTISLNDFSTKGPSYDLAMDGFMTAGEGVKPEGKGTIRAKTLLPLIDALNKAPADLGMGQAVPMVIAFNAMAKKDSDGSLRWDIEGTRDGKFLINGVDYAALASLGGGLPAPDAPDEQ